MSDAPSRPYTIIAATVKKLAQAYVRVKKPTVVAVAGSVGKTSTKLMLAHLLSGKNTSYMDDSYNNGLGLYLSVFEQKIPTSLTSPWQWVKTFGVCLMRFVKPAPDILIVEYGIDHPGDMDDMTNFIQPDISLLTAVTPEHMEYMKTIDGVGDEETKVLKAAKQFGVYNADDVAAKYISGIKTPLHSYGSNASNDASYVIEKWLRDGAEVSVTISGTSMHIPRVQLVSEPLVRQLIGAALVAHKLGVTNEELSPLLASATPAASRMRLFDGIHGSTIIDDTTNFSPDAGIEALKALKRLPAKRHIAVLGNMHELGEYEDEGFERVSNEFAGLSIIVLVGKLSIEKFTPYAKQAGFIEGETLLHYDTSVAAGIALRDQLQKDDLVIIKGPFGGFYLEETVKKLLANQDDSQYLTRQSPFWQERKKAHFGDAYFK